MTGACLRDDYVRSRRTRIKLIESEAALSGVFKQEARECGASGAPDIPPKIDPPASCGVKMESVFIAHRARTCSANARQKRDVARATRLECALELTQHLRRTMKETIR
jgi:hypothetical protein